MARYRARIDTPLPAAATFDYVGDFANTAEWDPGVRSAALVGSGPIVTGSTFRLELSFLGRAVPVEYVVTEWDPPRRVVLHADARTFVSHDEITVATHGTGSRLEYDADVRLKGPVRFADPVLSIVFKRVADRALDGLRRELSRREGKEVS